MIENNLFGDTLGAEPCSDSDIWNFSNIEYVCPDGVPTENFEILSAVETQDDVKTDNQKVVTERYLKFSVLGTGKNNILVDNILKVSSEVVALSNPRTVQSENLTYFDDIEQYFIPRIHWIEFLEATGLNALVFTKEFSRVEATVGFVQAVTTKATEDTAGENLLIDGTGQVIGTWTDITTDENKPNVSPISSSAGTVFTTAFHSNTDFLISTDNLVSFKETPFLNNIGELQTATKVIQINPDCESISPECELSFPACQFADNACFFRPQSPFAQYNERISAPIETKEIDSIAVCRSPFEIKVWATTEPTLYNAKKNITDFDISYGIMPGDDSQIEITDNGDGSWTFSSSDIVEWFSFKDFDTLDDDTNITKIEVIGIPDVKTLYESFAGLTSMTDIIFADLSMTKNIQSFSGAWRDCSSLTSFPSLDVSSGEWFNYAWDSCTSLSSCPGTDGTITIPDGATTTDMCLGI